MRVIVFASEERALEKRVVCVKLLAAIMKYGFIDLAIKNYRKNLVK